MKKTLRVVGVLLIVFLSGCGHREESSGKADTELRTRIIGNWIIDVDKTNPGWKKMLEDRGLPPQEVQNRMQELAEIDKRTKAVITPESLAVFEGENKRELKYRWTGPDKILFTMPEGDGPARVICPDGKTLQFVECNRSQIIWKRE